MKRKRDSSLCLEWQNSAGVLFRGLLELQGLKLTNAQNSMSGLKTRPLKDWNYRDIGLHALRARHAFASEHCGAGEEPLVAGDFIVVVIEEFEISFLQLEHRYVGGRAHFERAAIVE